MSDSAASTSAKKIAAPAKGKRRGKLPLILGGGVLLLGLAGAGAYFLVPGVQGMVHGLLGQTEEAHAAPAATPAPAAAAQPRVTFIELPELALSLPNAGRPRQLRLALAVEINGDPILIRPSLNNPRIYDALILYLRTLRDGELEGALAVDRLRGDLFRRLDLLLGPNVVRDVLITSFVLA